MDLEPFQLAFIENVIQEGNKEAAKHMATALREFESTGPRPTCSLKANKKKKKKKKKPHWVRSAL